jgi:hypothetical protein
MSQFFDLFPILSFDLNKDGQRNFTLLTDIFFRIKVLETVKSNVLSYYTYLINDGETPDILADKIYGSCEAHWIILMANDIIDPQYDWPLSSDAFTKYIKAKYGSIAAATQQIHHYVKKITRSTNDINGSDQIDTIYTQYIDATINTNPVFSSNNTTIPYETYDNTPLFSQDLYTNSEGTSIIIVQETTPVTCYDYEDQLNEEKRSIKIILPEFYSQIMDEFKALIEANDPRKRYSGLKSARI